MICSVKFLEPTVRLIDPLSEFDWIRSPLVSVPVSALVVSSSSPQAAMANVRASAAINANRARNRGWVLIGCVLRLVWLCRFRCRGRRKPMRSGPHECDLTFDSHALRRQEPLDARERELECEREQG